MVSFPTHTERGTRRPSGETISVEATALEAELRKVLRGEARFDDGSRALYSTDASNYRQVPIGVVLPKDAEDVARTVELCRQFGAPITARGGGTSLAGQCCNVAIVLDFSKYMNQLVQLDPGSKRARVQPGIVLDTLREAAERHRLTFGPDPSTHNHCTLGGMIGNNSCGVHSVMAGRTAENVEELEILTYRGLRLRVGPTSEAELQAILREGGERGEIYSKLVALRDRYAKLIRERFPDIPRRVSGYNLDELLPEKGFHVARALVGTEGTCVTVLEAGLRLVDSPPVRNLLVLGFEDVATAADHGPEILEYGPTGLEGMDDLLVEDNRRKGMNREALEELPEGGGWLLVEFGGDTKEEADARARKLMSHFERTRKTTGMRLFDDKEEIERIWKTRESGLGATARTPENKDTWEGWEDSAVPPAKLGDYLRDLRKLYDEYDYKGAFYGHFGQGCVHTRINFELRTREGIDKYRSFVEDASHLVVRYGGSLSGEHGDGQSRAELLHIMYGPELVQAFREFKRIWDPDGRMNPGKVVDPYRRDDNLRLGTDYRPIEVETHFAYPEDSGNFSRAVLRCVGIGECRRPSKGVMCPSYRATREEMHSTRGRARLLFEMLEGNPIQDVWKSEEVKEALDLCLACKGCKHDCPVNVDMATYKAEFLAHYYKRRLRPRHAYAFGLIWWWSRLASKLPEIVNFFTQTRPFAAVAKWMAGMPQQRQIPVFATQTFRQWFESHEPKHPDGPPVLLWVDTFNNYFHPWVAQAAVEVLEAAGYRVQIPEQELCCGRPLYDYGFLGKAKALLQQILATLRPQIVEGVPLVGLEPSCLATFRDELLGLLPHSEDAHRLSQQSFLLSEFLQQKADGFEVPKLARKAVAHGHCHHKSVLKFDAERELLKKLVADVEILDAGCCGMAGSFGFEKEHYDISMQVGELELLPAVRKAEAETLLVANGFSCQEQVAQATGRRPLHIAEVLQMALREGSKAQAKPSAEVKAEA